MCQVTVVSPLLFRRHGTERPTWPRRAALDLLRWGVAVSPSGSTHDPRASAANVRAFLRAAPHPRRRLCRVCALAVPLGTPACPGAPVLAAGGRSLAALPG